MNKKLLIIAVLSVAAVFLPAALFSQGEVTVTFNDFPWGTSMETFTARMGEPIHVEEFNGFKSLLYENVPMAGFRAFMVAYFSQYGLEGGAFYFDTNNLDELRRCYTAVQRELVARFGPVPPAPEGRFEEMLRELRVYETAWDLPGGYIHLRVNTRFSDPVTLWISFPTLTKMLDGS